MISTVRSETFEPTKVGDEGVLLLVGLWLSRQLMNHVSDWEVSDRRLFMRRARKLTTHGSEMEHTSAPIHV